MQDVKFLEKVWHLLITHGGVCKSHGNDYPDPINYYSGNFNADREATEEALKYIVQHGVKYTECSDITGGTGGSGGSLTEILEVPYLMGELVTGNGKRYYWGTKSNALSLLLCRPAMQNRVLKLTCKIVQPLKAPAHASSAALPA